MDPNETLKQIRALVGRSHAPAEAGNEAADLDELGELFEALDNWLTSGGFLPEAWKRERAGSDQYKVWTEVTTYKT